MRLFRVFGRLLKVFPVIEVLSMSKLSRLKRVSSAMVVSVNALQFTQERFFREAGMSLNEIFSMDEEPMSKSSSCVCERFFNALSERGQALELSFFMVLGRAVK